MKKNYQIPISEIISLTLSGRLLEDDPAEASGEGGVEANKGMIFEDNEIVSGGSNEAKSSLWD